MRIVFVTCPQERAADILRQLLEERLVAGGNIIFGVRSLYRWKGQICDETEAILLMETADVKIAAMMARLEEIHPYEVPKILTFEPEEKLATYLDWVLSETDN